MKGKGMKNKKKLAAVLGVLAICAVAIVGLCVWQPWAVSSDYKEDVGLGFNYVDPSKTTSGQALIEHIENYVSIRDWARRVVSGVETDGEYESLLINFCEFPSAVQREVLLSGNDGLMQDIVATYGEEETYKDSDELGDVNTDEELLGELYDVFGEEYTNDFLAAHEEMAAVFDQDYTEIKAAPYGCWN